MTESKATAVADLIKSGHSEQEAIDIARSRARMLRKHRVLAGLMFVMLQAEREVRKVTYSEFYDAVGINPKSAFHETNILLGIIMRICWENAWPIYNVLVCPHSEDIPGNGFFTVYDELAATVVGTTDRKTLVDSLVKECHTKAVPSMVTICCAVMDHFQ